MNDFPIQDLLFVVKVIREKSYLMNFSALVKAITNISNYAATHWMKKGVDPQPNPPIAMAMSDEAVCEQLEACAADPEAGIPLPLIIWLTQFLLSIFNK